MSPDLIDEVQGEIMDLRSHNIASLEDALECAEMCETEADLRANLDEAIKLAGELAQELVTLRAKADKP